MSSQSLQTINIGLVNDINTLKNEVNELKKNNEELINTNKKLFNFFEQLQYVQTDILRYNIINSDGKMYYFSFPGFRDLAILIDGKSTYSFSNKTPGIYETKKTWWLNNNNTNLNWKYIFDEKIIGIPEENSTIFSSSPNIMNPPELQGKSSELDENTITFYGTKQRMNPYGVSSNTHLTIEKLIIDETRNHLRVYAGGLRFGVNKETFDEVGRAELELLLIFASDIGKEAMIKELEKLDNDPEYQIVDLAVYLFQDEIYDFRKGLTHPDNYSVWRRLEDN